MISSILIKTKRKEGFTLIELLVVIAIIGTLSTIGFLALTSSQDGATDAVKIGEVRTVQSAITIASATSGGGNKFPGSGTCGKLSTLPTAVKDTMTNINVDSNEYFYCSGGTSGSMDATWYVVGAVGISNENHQSLTASGEIDGNAGGKITTTLAGAINTALGTSLTTATPCNNVAGDAVLCLGVGI